MKISTKGRYGLRAMVDLAVHSSGEHVSLNSIADRQNVSISYLEQVFSTLRKAGLVNSIKGAQGGYILANDPTNIKVGAVLRVLEGDLSIVEEVIENDLSSIEFCIKTALWDKINETINKIVDTLTLDDLIHLYFKLNSSDNNMYYI